MESWRKVWRESVDILSTEGLQALREALIEDDPRLLQGGTTIPVPLLSLQHWPVEAACVYAYAGWRGDELSTVKEVEEFFSNVCYELDKRLGEIGGCRWFLNTYDNWSRQEMIQNMLPEVELALVKRGTRKDESSV